MEAEHHHLPGYSEGSQEVMGYGTTLLQVPAVVVAPPRESSSTGNPLPKQNSQPELCSESRPVVQQLGQHPNMTRSLESLGSMGASTGYLQPSCSNPQQQQQLPFMQLLVKPSTRGPTSGTSTLASSSSLSAAQSQMANSLRKIQPKPSSEEGRLSVKEEASFYKKEAYHQQPPLIRLTPSEDVHTPGPPRLNKSASENHLSSRDLGPAPLIQSVSEDTGLDPGLSRTMASTPSSSSFSSSLTSNYVTPTSGHRLALRDGPALGCNYCWNSTDEHGRIQRRKTKYHCPECRTNLCIVPCYQKYHKQMEKADDTDKQINKILTKTSSL